MNRRTTSLPALLAGIAVLLAAAAAVPAHAAAPSNADANNPLARFRAFNVHDYYIPSLSEMDDQNANTFWLRYAQPFGKWLFRASLPVPRVPTGAGETTSGLGDLNAFAAYLIDTGDPGVSFGIGPQITVPTASEDESGTGKWQGGFATIYFNARSTTFQWGGLVTWQADFAGDDDRPDTNVLALQPFYFVQFGKGLYFRGTPIAVFNLETNAYNVPLGAGIGKVIPAGDKVFNIFVEPQFTILDRGAGQPELQVFFGFNTQFARK
jgi:hypothetical protein